MGRIAEELDVIAAGLDEVERTMADEGVGYARAGRPFAHVRGSSASFLLASGVAAAALRTPGVSASPRGPGWVSLDISAGDRFTADRARAWFESAWRLAGPKGH